MDESFSDQPEFSDEEAMSVGQDPLAIEPTVVLDLANLAGSCYQFVQDRTSYDKRSRTGLPVEATFHEWIRKVIEPIARPQEMKDWRDTVRAQFLVEDQG